MIEYLKKCPNCNNGFVDGGKSRRISRELKILGIRLDSEIASLKEKDRNKRSAMIRALKDKYSKLIAAKRSELKSVRIKRCAYCEGYGTIRVRVSSCCPIVRQRRKGFDVDYL